MSSTTTTICAFCHVAVELDESTACESCGTRHHTDCWEQNEGCAVPLCEGGPKLPYIAPAPTPGDDLGGGGRRRIIELDPDGELVTRRAAPPAPRRRPAPWRVGAAVATAAVVLATVAMIATRGSSSSSTTAGPAAAPAQAQSTPPAPVPAPALTARRIAAEKARVKHYAVAANQAAAAARSAAAAAARRRAAAAGPPAGATNQVATPVQPVQQQPTRPVAPVTPVAKPTKPSTPKTVVAKPVTGNFG